MKIAYVMNSVEGGGAAQPVPAVITALRERGATVRVLALTPRDRRGLPAITAAGVETLVRDGGDGGHFDALSWLDGEIAAWGPDLIWTSLTRATLLGQMVGRRRGIPVVSWQHAAFLKPANLFLLRVMQRLTTLWIGDSNSVTRLTGERLGVPPERLATWPLFAADPQAPVATPWQRGQPLRLGSLGRLHPVKGYDVLAAALVRLRDDGFTAPVPFTVDLAGEGWQRGELEALVAAKELSSLRLPGYTSAPRDFLAGLHLYLQPSRSEGLCIAAHEAMQAGLPVIGSAVGEMPFTIVDGYTGLTVPPGDPYALAAALRRLLSDPDRLETIGRASRTRVFEMFGAAAFDAACDSIFRRLPGAHAASARHQEAIPVPIDRFS